MPEITLSEADRIAVIFAKLLDANQPDPDYRFLDSLSYDHREVAYRVLTEGKDYDRREFRFRSECLGRGWFELIEHVDRSSPQIDLDQAAMRDTWVFRGFQEIYAPLSPQEWLVTNIIPKPSVLMFYGAPKSLKSILVMDLAVCVAAGQNWLPLASQEGGYTTVPTRVLWVDFENGERRMRERFAALGRARRLAEDTPLSFTSMPLPMLEANDKAQIGNLQRRIEHYQAGFVVIDHFGATLGGADENSSQVAEVMANYRTISELTGATIGLIHHQVKNAGKYGDSGDSLRGHGSILANLDLAILVKRDGLSRDRILAVPVAIRGADFDTLGGLWTFEHKAGTRELEIARFFGWEVEDINAQVDNTILDVVAEEADLNQTALRAAVCERSGVGDVTVRKRIAALVKNGKLKVTEGKQKSKIYNLP